MVSDNQQAFAKPLQHGPVGRKVKHGSWLCFGAFLGREKYSHEALLETEWIELASFVVSVDGNSQVIEPYQRVES